MQRELQIQLYKLLSALSLAMDYNRTGLMRHHQRVALLSLYLAGEMQMTGEDRMRLFCSAVIHDAGTSTFREKAKLEHFEVTDPWHHCEKGFALLHNTGILAPLAEVILHHHDRWDGNNRSGLAGDSIPLASRIIFLADRVDVLAQRPGNILDYREEIVRTITAHSGTMFDPDLVEIFIQVARKECLWLDLTSQYIDYHLQRRLGACPVIIGPEEITGISRIFAEIIDGKSPYTYRHSRLVAEVAAYLARRAGFDEARQKNMYVAGLLHDLGKLSIPEEILEKPGALSAREFNLIKQHTYITHLILGGIDGMEEINLWASYHHEKLNGEGYPFRIKGENLSPGSRIMAVADIFSALVENRPYRAGLPRSKVENILAGQVSAGAIDGDIVHLLVERYREAESLQQKINT
ncbi:HD domain-containing protein [Desulfallas sp. Bu1-1]|uniref:HD-GYP domain-containing protein n=1 Tax=Desulfallas sp. Bu1-1 TaxID=2787620 RepID=UPI00189F3BED|nr:HD domain-containing phosphohydrolase [Desulfallas sp. Bu1-1]MBF7081833.1 HD domain-containing protein [Desulfallas sp. Bu1-1]